MLSLACLAMTLLSTPATAGTWKFSCTDASTASGGSSSTYSNSDVFMGTPQSYSSTTMWTPPADATSYSLPSFGFSTSGGTADADTIRSEDVSITAKITMTWVPDSSLPSDPAPASLWLIESSSAQWVAYYGGAGGPATTGSGSADDGIGDAPVASYASGGLKSGEVSSSANAAANTVPPAHWFQQPVSGGVVTLTRTFHASASASLPQNNRPGSMTLGCSFGGYTIGIHAQPYNYAKVPGGGNMGYDGSLSFTYDWSSTSGNKNDLTTCYWHEYVSYPGTAGTAANPTLYSPPNPPFSYVAYPNPTVSPGTGTNGGAMTGTNRVVDTQGVPPLVPPSLYTYGTFTATQVYEFDDTATGETNVQIPGPDSGLFSIVREFKLYDVHDYIYTCTKDNHTASVLKPF